VLETGGGNPLGDASAQQLLADAVTDTISPAPSLGQLAIASFKPASGQTIARVGAAGALLQGTTTAVAPAFGQATVAGHLLVAVVSNSGAGPTISNGVAGWVQAVQNTSNVVATIFYKPNCGTGETAPAFASSGAVTNMVAQLSEWSGVATASPLDQIGTANSSSATTTVAATTIDAQAGDLVVMLARYGLGSTGTATFSDSINNSAVVNLSSDDGTLNQIRHTRAVYAINPATASGQGLAIVGFNLKSWPGLYDGQGFNRPAAGTKATITLAANATRRWVADNATGYQAQVSGAAASIELRLIDGVSGGAATLLTQQSAITATAATVDRPPPLQSGRFANAAINTALTFEFASAVAGVVQAVSLGAYLQ
jgi:hypothetical protein